MSHTNVPLTQAPFKHRRPAEIIWSRAASSYRPKRQLFFWPADEINLLELSLMDVTLIDEYKETNGGNMEPENKPDESKTVRDEANGTEQRGTKEDFFRQGEESDASQTGTGADKSNEPTGNDHGKATDSVTLRDGTPRDR